MMQMTKFLTKMKVTIMTKVTTKQKRVEILKCGNLAKKACNNRYETATTTMATVVRVALPQKPEPKIICSACQTSSKILFF